VNEALVYPAAQGTQSGCSPWRIASSSGVRSDRALTILDEGCAHDVAHDIHQSATHVEQAIDPLRFFT
jgi:hypothetical protein